MELEIKTATQALWNHHASRSTGKEGCFGVGWVIDHYYQGEIGLLLHNGDNEVCVWYRGDPLGCLLIL